MACASEDTGFHSAMTSSQCCIGSVGAKVLARNVIGNSTVNMTPFTASTERITEPMSIPNQIMLKPNTRINAKASAASATLPRIRQPIANPVTAITTTPIVECSRLATLRPINTDDREIGSDRNRSMMPLSTSAVIPDATTNAVNTIVCAWIPGSRNSRYDAPPPVAIDAPNTNANSSTNMIGCTVTSLSISGIRLVWIMLRFTMIHDCCTMLVGCVRAGCS